MTGWRRGSALAGLTALVVAAVTVMSPAPATASEKVDGRTLFRFTDPEIIESSGLVDTGDEVLTVNDSGAGAVLYAVDPASGDTLRRTTYTDRDVVDVEALAPGRGGSVWVGDIGDNEAARSSITAYRLAQGGETAAAYELSYPGGPRDAEALLVHPRNGRLFVVSKTVFGGVVYAAPPRLEAGTSHRLRRFATVEGLVTDGAFLPDGRHVVLRSYGSASVYTFPGFDLRGTVSLPAQRQGEAISVGPDGRVLLSSEGRNAPVLEVELPGSLVDVAASESPVSPRPSEGSRVPGVGGNLVPSQDLLSNAWVRLGAAGLAALGLLLLVRRR